MEFIKRRKIMVNDHYIKQLEDVIKQMLKPIKGIPLNLIIESVSGYKVLEFNRKDPENDKLLKKLVAVAKTACKEVNKSGIKRPRPNEVGNDIESYVLNALHSNKIKAGKPFTKSGKQQAVGYPDIEFTIPEKQSHYIECKTYSEKTLNTSMRSFYLSPSENFKINHDGIHFIMSFEIYVASSNGNDNIYKIKGWKIIDAYYLECDVKYEFNSDNSRLYKEHMILAEEKI